MTNYSIGHQAEQRAALYLQNRGYKIISTNWKTSRCEIDVIAQYQDVVYFVEVKYRKTGNQGSGLDYITTSKLNRMIFAAEVWMQRYQWHGDFRLAAIELAGPQFAVGLFVKDL